jgi:hypothetical protein
MRPDVPPAGTVVAMLVLVAEVIEARVTLNFDLLLPAVGSKFVPVIVTGVPATAMVGLKSVIAGNPASPTTNDVLLVALPAGVVIAIGPVVAPTGTVVMIFVAVALVMVAATPLKVTLF